MPHLTNHLQKLAKLALVLPLNCAVGLSVGDGQHLFGLETCFWPRPEFERLVGA
jgi:hypothetical protein